VSNNFRKTGKAHNKNFAEGMMQAPAPSEASLRFQIFFLTNDQSESVEVLETNTIDFEEILKRLTMGDSVFIKCKKQEMLESRSRANEEENKPWYFNHY
jgi:hypothetical protein